MGQNLGKVGICPMGDYASGKSYERLSSVFYNHEYWVAVKDVPVGAVPSATSEYWQKMASRGEQGERGQSYVDKELVPIVNNLTQGGSENVLSAEQGKVLKQELTELESEVLNNHIDGKGSEYSKIKIYGLKSNRTYRIFLKKNEWDVSGVSAESNYAKFGVNNIYNGESEQLVRKGMSEYIADIYDITLPTNSDYIEIGVRATKGERVEFSIVDYTDKKYLSDTLSRGNIAFNFEIGTPNAQGVSDGNPARLMCVTDYIEPGIYHYDIPKGYAFAINQRNALNGEPTTSGWIEGSGQIKITKPINIFIVAKSDKVTPISVTEGNLLVFGNNKLFPYEAMESIEYRSEWTDGAIQYQGSDIGNITNNALRINKAYLGIPKGSSIFYQVKDGYKVRFYEWDGVSATMQIHDFTQTSGCFETSMKNIYVIGAKEDDGVISANEGVNISVIMSFSFQPMSRYVLKNSNLADNESWNQGAPYTSGENVGNLGQNMPIRCTKVLQNVAPKTSIPYAVKDGYKIGFIEWDGISSTCNIISTFALTRQGWGVYTSTYPIVYVLCGKIDDSDIVITEAYNNVALMYNNSLSALSEIAKMNIQKDRNISYMGERLPFGNRMGVELFTTLPNWENSQAAAVYNNKLIVCYAMDEIEAGKPNGVMYDLSTKSKICDLYFNAELNGKTYEFPHANQISFGNEYYNEDSHFPLLYISQVLTSKGTKGGVMVYDLQFDSNTNEYTPILVQFIQPNVNDEMLMEVWGKYTPNYIIDYDNDWMFVMNYPQPTWDDFAGKQYVTKFRLPKLSDGELITLSSSDLVDSFTLPSCRGIQSSLYHRGKIYLQEGIGGNGGVYLRVLDIASKAIVTDIDLHTAIPEEPQGLFVWNNMLLWYTAGTSGKIFSLEFN